KLDVFTGDIVIEGNVTNVVRLAFHARETLRPAAIFVLTVEHELDGALQRRTQARRAALQIHTQQELRRLACASIIKRRVAVIVMEFFEPPAVLADRLIPAARTLLAREVVVVVPAARWMLRGDQAFGH